MEMLARLQATAGSIPGDTLGSAAMIADWNRLYAVIEYANRRVESIDPVLITPTMLERMHASFTALHGPLTEFVSRMDAPTLDHAQIYADNMLDSLRELPAPVIKDGAAAFRITQRIRDDLERAVTVLQGHASVLEAQLQQLEAQAAHLSAEITSRQERLDALISRVQDSFDAAQTQRSADFIAEQGRRASEWIESEKGRTDSAQKAISQFEQKSASIQQETREDLDDILSKQRTDWLKWIESAAAERRENEANLERSATSIVGLIETQSEKATKIVGLISQTGMAGGFQKVANAERASGWVWAVTATVALVGLIKSAAGVDDAHLAGDDDTARWLSLAAHIFASLSFLVLAGFAARQAGQHRDNERRNRRMELELASLNPFLSDLEEADRRTVLKQMAERMFAQPEVPAGRDGNTVQLPSKEALDALIQFGKSFAGKG